MEKRILFLTEKKSMIANALIQGLEEAAFHVEQVKPNVTELSRLAERPEIWLLYLNGLENKMKDVLSYIRDQINEHQVRFFVIGTEDELGEIMQGFPANLLKASFTRPFRTDEVIDRLTMEALNVEKISKAKKILIIDDDTMILQAFKEMLQGNYRVFTANSGMNAIQLLVNTEVDLILLDYEMPVVKGPQVLEMLRSEEHTKDIPVMFLTSKNDRESIINVMSLSPVNYLLKSLPQSEIFGTIKSFLEG